MRKLWQQSRSLPGCLPSFSFVGLPRPTTAWHRNETGRRGQWHQRMDIKSQAQLDPATIGRCGHWALTKPPGTASRVAGATSRLIILHIHQLEGLKRRISTKTWVTGSGCLSQAREQVRLVSGALGDREKKTVYFTPPASVNSEHKLSSWGHCNERYTPCRVLHARKWWEKNHDGGGCQCFTVFLRALEPLTLARVHHLPPRSHKRFIVSWACRSLGVKWVITFHSHLQTACTKWASLTAINGLGCFCWKTKYFSDYVFLFKGCALFLLIASLISFWGN